MAEPATSAAERPEVTVAVVYPDLMGTYGDGGNARILVQRLRWRGIGAQILTVGFGTPVPRSAELYLLGGGEDRPQSLAAAELAADGGLGAAVAGGAAVLAVCAGLQVLGTRFLTADGIQPGVGLIDAETLRGLDTRAVGELVVDPDPGLGLPRLSGYENHAGATRLGPGVAPFATVVSGIGNGVDGVDGYIAGRVVGTYLHGPALARNPELADWLLAAVLGELGPLDPDGLAADAEARALREERLSATRRVGRPDGRGRFGGSSAPGGWAGRIGGGATRAVRRVTSGGRSPRSPWRNSPHS